MTWPSNLDLIRVIYILSFAFLSVAKKEEYTTKAYRSIFWNGKFDARSFPFCPSFCLSYSIQYHHDFLFLVRYFLIIKLNQHLFLICFQRENFCRTIDSHWFDSGQRNVRKVSTTTTTTTRQRVLGNVQLNS